MMAKQRRVLALQNVWDDPPGYLGEIMQEHGIPWDVVKADETPNAWELLSDLTPYAAIISLGGPQHAAADERYPYLAEEKALILRALEQDVPFLGVCLGGQLLAHALGAAVTRHSMTELGFFEVRLTDEGRADPFFQGLPDNPLVFQWHMDTFSIPAGAVRLATNANTTNQAFRLGRWAYALQYHIELTPAMLDTWTQYPDYQREIVKELGPEGPSLIEEQRRRYYQVYREYARQMFENFLRISGFVLEQKS